MKALLTLTMILLTAWLGLLARAAYLPADIRYESVITIEAPLPVVWNALTRLEDQDNWLVDKKVLYNFDNTSRQVQWNLKGKTLLINQQVRIRESARAIDFLQIGHEKYSLLENFNETMQLRELPDGATEVRWSYQYHIPELLPRLVDNRENTTLFENSLQRNIRALKRYIVE